MKKWICILLSKSLLFLSLFMMTNCEVPSHRLNVRGYPRNNKFEFVIRENRKNYSVKVLVPPYLEEKFFREEILIFGPGIGPRGKIAVATAWNGDSSIDIEKTEFVGDQILIHLNYVKSNAELAAVMGAGELEEAEGVFEKPNNYASMARDKYPSVGKLKTRTNRAVWGLVGFVGSCTGTLVGKNVVLTNAHCLHTEEDCSYASVTFSDYHEKNQLGQRVHREFKCSQVIYSSLDYDMTLFTLEDYPSRHYPVQNLDLRPLEIQNGSWLFMIGATPNRENKHVEICQVKKDLRVVGIASDQKFRYLTKILVCARDILPGDSGSPVFNHEGNVVGVVWGSTSTSRTATDSPDMVAMTPLWIMGAAFKDPRYRIFKSYLNVVRE